MVSTFMDTIERAYNMGETASQQGQTIFVAGEVYAGEAIITGFGETPCQIALTCRQKIHRKFRALPDGQPCGASAFDADQNLAGIQ